MSQQTLPPTFQEIIFRLEHFWAEHGAITWQPYSEKVGAGTANPATTLRVLGPEPWRVGYVEPSYRPDDGRFAENPNRMQMHHQYQVILKPDPGNPQEIYLESLRAMGIDLDAHDVRFVEDNWESPALGAWGLGWEVWLDGLEITQFTYFQQAGGLDLDPVSVELTYGLERIAMFIQDVKEVWDLQWDAQHTYGDILKIQEIEHSDYAFNTANVQRLRQMYDLYEAEFANAIEKNLVVPAYDYVLRCSHTFNLLDTRGAIGVTERAGYFRRMRDMTRRVAEAYVAKREEAGFPLLDANAPAYAPPIMPAPEPLPAGMTAADLLLEIGVEELPPHEVRSAMAQLQKMASQALDEARLSYENLVVSATPRRLAVQVHQLQAQQASQVQEFRGPPADRAFDAAGHPTKAALGFARGKGVDASALEIREEGGKRYVYAVKQVEGRPTYELLPDILRGLVAGIRFGKSMRWNASNTPFSRPIRWLVGLYGPALVPFSFAGISSGTHSRGLRPHGSPQIAIPSAEKWREQMAAAGVVVDRAQRQQLIVQGLQEVAATVDGVVPEDTALLEQVTDLVEQPFALLGHFEPDFLELPAAVLITVMKKHQRYFPVVDAAGKLLPHFITIVNGQDRDPELVRKGNEAVIRARYADAAYFVKEDRKHSLESFNAGLVRLTFQEKLGSMLDKVHRLEKLTPEVADLLGLSPDEKAAAARAATLSKADLATSMVVEMTSLQGIMGEIYALGSNEAPDAARAIREQYSVKPEHPLSPAGLALNIADRLDSLVGLFAVGLAPKSTADPFGLRRAALALVQTLMASGQNFDIRAGLQAAAKLQPVTVTAEVLTKVMDFVAKRLYVALRDQGFSHDVVEAVLAEQAWNPARAHDAVAALADAVQQPWWEDAFTAYARTKRIVRKLDETYALNQDAYVEPSAQALHTAYEAAAAQLAAQPDIPTLARALRELRPAIDTFFESTLVMAEDRVLRAARLALVQRIAALPDGLADLTKLRGF